MQSTNTYNTTGTGAPAGTGAYGALLFLFLHSVPRQRHLLPLQRLTLPLRHRLSAVDYDRHRSPFDGGQGRLDGSRNGAEQGEEGPRQPVRNHWRSPHRWSRIDHHHQHGLRRSRTHDLDWLRRNPGDDHRRRVRWVGGCFGRRVSSFAIMLIALHDALQ